MIQLALLKLSLVNLISKDGYLVFYLSVYLFTNLFILLTSNIDVIIDSPVDLTSLTTSFKKCNLMLT